MPKVSIIIPCYNHGIYIRDTLDSLTNIPNEGLFETIIVNDGSTDPYTNEVLIKLKENPNYQVIFKKNGGLSDARNTGIRLSKGEYILPLDADNMIRPEYLYRGIELMDAGKADIVYGNRMQFGDKTGERKAYPYNLQRLMLGNYIDACAIYKKAVWETIGGYDTNMKTGWEDWEFWLNAGFHNFKFQYVDEVLFDYRVLEDSMVSTLNAQKTKANAIIEYLIQKHSEHFGLQYIDNSIMDKFNANPIGFISKMVLKKYFPSYFNKLTASGKLRRYL